MSFVAIEFGDDRILVASLAAGRQAKLQQAFSIPAGDELDEQLGQRLKSELSKHGLGRSDAIVVVSRSSAEMREVTVPPAPDEELPDMVRLLARNEFATLNDNWLLDFVPLGSDPTVQRTVLAAGISPELKKQVGNILEAAGLRVKHGVLRPFAAVNLLRSRLSDGKCRLIANPSDDQTDIVIVVGHEPIATRTVRIPSSHDEDQQARFICGEIKRTLASSHGSMGDRRVDEILFFGDPAKNKPFEEMLRDKLDLHVEFLDPFQLVDVSAGLTKPDNSARFAALIGSLVQQSAGLPFEIDFLNPRRPVTKETDRSRLLIYGGLAAATILLAVVFGWWTLRSQAQEIAELNTELQSAVNRNSGDGGKRPSVEQIMGEVTKIDQWKQADVNWLEELYQYSSRFLTPDDVIVDSFDAGLRRGEPRIIVRSRVAGVQKESALIDALDSRPYQVVPTKSGISEDDPSYPMSFDFNVLLTEDRSDVIDKVDEKTAQFLRERNSRDK